MRKVDRVLFRGYSKWQRKLILDYVDVIRRDPIPRHHAFALMHQVNDVTNQKRAYERKTKMTHTDNYIKEIDRHAQMLEQDLQTAQEFLLKLTQEYYDRLTDEQKDSVQSQLFDDGEFYLETLVAEGRMDELELEETFRYTRILQKILSTLMEEASR